MATLSSINKQDILVIKPLYWESKEEGWITSELNIIQKGVRIAKATEPFFQINEINQLISDIKNLLDKKTDKVESSFLEPNFELKIESAGDKDIFIIDALCRLFIHFEDGEIKSNDEADRKINFKTKKQDIIVFLERLTSELKDI